MTTPPTNANPTLSLNLPGYDATGHQANVAVNLTNITTDATTGVIYGILAIGSSALPTNAAKETGGNLDAITALLNGTNAVGGTLLGGINFGNSLLFSLATSPYPQNATPITASSGNVANASAVATLAGTSGKTTYISGFQVSGSGATAGLPVIVTVAGLISGTNSYIYSASVGVLLPNTPLIVSFDPPIPASAVNTAIVVTCPALGLGNTNNAVSAQGYQL